MHVAIIRDASIVRQLLRRGAARQINRTDVHRTSDGARLSLEISKLRKYANAQNWKCTINFKSEFIGRKIDYESRFSRFLTKDEEREIDLSLFIYFIRACPWMFLFFSFRFHLAGVLSLPRLIINFPLLFAARQREPVRWRHLARADIAGSPKFKTGSARHTRIALTNQATVPLSEINGGGCVVLAGCSNASVLGLLVPRSDINCNRESTRVFNATRSPKVRAYSVCGVCIECVTILDYSRIDRFTFYTFTVSLFLSRFRSHFGVRR